MEHNQNTISESRHNLNVQKEMFSISIRRKDRERLFMRNRKKMMNKTVETIDSFKSEYNPQLHQDKTRVLQQINTFIDNITLINDTQKENAFTALHFLRVSFLNCGLEFFESLNEILIDETYISGMLSYLDNFFFHDMKSKRIYIGFLTGLTRMNSDNINLMIKREDLKLLVDSLYKEVDIDLLADVR